MSVILTESKYRNKHCEEDGYGFASMAERQRYRELKLRLAAGEIDRLVLQPHFDLDVNGVRVGRYLADFEYRETANGHTVVEDVKGMKTPVYKLKRKLVEALYGIVITEVEA